jgi:hypothetical protein
MITCQHARQLFDRYLDDELSSSLQAELHAHVINCGSCQNHLALIEACGDVIRLDRREPALSGTFTDRVLAARREQVSTSSTAARRWRRAGWWIAGPVAAAASIALILTVGVPTFDGQPMPTKGTVVDARIQAAPKAFQDNLMNLTGRQQDPQAAEELAGTQEMKALPFLEALVNPLVQGARNAAAGTRQSYEDIELLVRFGFAGMNERLRAEYLKQYPEATAQSADRFISALDILDQALPPIPTDLAPSGEQPAPSNASPSKAAVSPDAL